MSPFSKVIYDVNQPEIAKVNRVNKTLFINPQIWKGLPKNQQEFVLLHEKGHLVLHTADEFQTNKYAVSKFAPVTALSNSELGKRIVVMREILTPREKAESGFAAETASASGDILSGLLGNASDILQVIGVGSQSRQDEAAAIAQANAQLIAAQSAANQKKNNTNIMIGVLAGVILIVIITLYFILKK